MANYVIWRFIRHRINNLDKRFQSAQQELIRSLYGREDTPPRWKFCVSYANGNLGHSVGSLFVKKYFDERSKADVGPIILLFQTYSKSKYLDFSKKNKHLDGDLDRFGTITIQ